MTNRDRLAAHEERLHAIQQRSDAATTGPWLAKPLKNGRCDGIAPVVAHNHGPEVDCWSGREECPAECVPEIVTTDSGVYGPVWPDAEFIAHAREDIPWLLEQLQSMRARIEELEQEKAELQRWIDGPEDEDFVSLTQQLSEAYISHWPKDYTGPIPDYVRLLRQAEAALHALQQEQEGLH